MHRYHHNKTCMSSWAIVFLLFGSCFLSIRASAQDRSSSPTLVQNPDLRRQTFRIGFLKADVEPLFDESLFYRMGKALESDSLLMNDLKAAGITSIAVIPVDGFRDMVRRMNHNEFDLVFCSSTVFVRQIGDYSVILQVRRSRDIWDTRGGGKVLQKGALIVSNNLYVKHNLDASNLTVSAFLRDARIAVVSSYSAPGYIFPLIKMRKDYNINTTRPLIFCDSSEEVVKYVISGLADAGCCERGAVDDVIQSTELEISSEKLVRIVFETEPIPTNPIVIRTIFHPQNSPIGRSLRNAIRGFFASLPSSMPRLENSRDEFFTNLREAIISFESAGE